MLNSQLERCFGWLTDVEADGFKVNTCLCHFLPHYSTCICFSDRDKAYIILKLLSAHNYLLTIMSFP